MTDLTATIWEERRTRYPNYLPRILRVDSSDVFTTLNGSSIRYSIAQWNPNGSVTWKTSPRPMTIKNLHREFTMTKDGTITRGGALIGLGRGSLHWAPITTINVSEGFGTVHYYTETPAGDVQKDVLNLTPEQADYLWEVLEIWKTDHS